MKKIIIALALLMNVCPLLAQNNKKSSIELKTPKDSLDYSLGIAFGRMVKESGFGTPNADVFMNAFNTFMKGDSLKIDMAAIQGIFKRSLEEAQAKELKKNLDEGEAFLAKNAKTAGVISTPSGLQYKVLQQGVDSLKPKAADNVKVFYKGTLLNGTVFDARESGEPISFALNQVIPGWTEGLQQIGKGGRIILYVPSNLAYGSRPVGQIPAGSVLVFEITLVDVQRAEAAPTTAE